jgi:hypothetical protein
MGALAHPRTATNQHALLRKFSLKEILKRYFGFKQR